MRSFSILMFILGFKFSFGQPNPQERYPERIRAITEQLKTDSLNYELIWERLSMNVNLMGGFGIHDEIFSFKANPIIEAERSVRVDSINTDFSMIYKNVIKAKKYDIVEEGDFYLNRILFYFRTHEINKAIQDAIYLRDSASYSRYWERGNHYNKWALYSLFNLYVVSNQYEEALEAIDTMLEKKKSENPEVYFSGHGSFLSYRDKIRLYEHFMENDKIIPFLKANCKEHFYWYFENSKESNNYYVETAKEQSLYLLKLITEYMKKYADTELPKYERIYRQLRIKVNENFEKINPEIDDSQLKAVVSEI